MSQLSFERWGEIARHIWNRAHYNVACAEEANAHYGDKFTSLRACSYFIRGAVYEVAKLIGNSLKKENLMRDPIYYAADLTRDEGEAMTQSAGVANSRARVMLIVAELDTGTGLHFCSHPTLSGANANLWFPLQEGQDLFAAVEQLMVMNHAANNVVRLDVFHAGDRHTDYKVTYNPEVRVL